MEVLKFRKLKLLRKMNGQSNQVTQSLKELKGIKNVMLNSDKNILTITYDLESINLKHIEELLENQDIRLDDSLLRKLKLSWHHFTEENELDNLHLNPNCCSDPKISQR